MALLIIYLVIAIGVSFMCSVLEAVLLSITPSYVEQKLQESPRSGKVLKSVKNNLENSISAILILNTFAHTMGAAGVGAQALKLFGEQWETVIAILLTLAILYLSEIIPKTLGATYWRQIALPAAHLINLLVKLVFPLVWFSSVITRFFTRKKRFHISREEILAFATLGYKGGVLANQENLIINNILKLRDMQTAHILTPRSMVHAVDKSASPVEVINLPRSEQFSRVPVYDHDIDHIVGVVLIKAILEGHRAGELPDTVGEMADNIYRVSEKLPVLQLLDVFIKRSEHIFVVEDEFGQTEGIVTLEDAIETLLGREITDETDTITDLQSFAKRQFRDRIRRKDKHPDKE